MVKKKREKTFYKYQCPITSEEFVTTRPAPNPDELMSVKAYYEMNTEEDDRPLVVKVRMGIVDKDNKQTPQ